MTTRRSLVGLIASGALFLLSQTASAVPMSFSLSQAGYTAGGAITGTITVDDLDMDGTIEGGTIFGPEVLALTVMFSGGPIVPPFVLGLAELTGFIWFTGLGPFVGDDAAPPVEGILLTGLPGTFIYASGLGPTGSVGGTVTDLTTGATDTSSIVLVLTPLAVPEPSSLALLGIAFAGFAALRRRAKGWA